MTDAEADAMFEATQPIGNAINAIAQAELTVAAVDEIPAEHRRRMDRALAAALDEARRDG